MCSIRELDCKSSLAKSGQWIADHMSQGIACVCKRKQWRMGEVAWSVHHSVPALNLGKSSES